MGVQEGYNDKYNMETPNKVDPFYNVVEGHKISLLKVHDMLENRSLIGYKKHAKY